MCSFMEVRDIYAREIMNSSGRSTIEVEVLAEDGNVGKASLPSLPAIKTAAKEKGRLDVENECMHINSVIADMLIGENVYDQLHVDRLLRNETDAAIRSGVNDGLRSSCTMGISMAVADAASKSLGLPLFRYLGGIFSRKMPVPIIKILECPGSWNLFLIPAGFSHFSDGLRSSVDVFHRLKKMMENRDFIAEAGSQGAYRYGRKSGHDESALSAEDEQEKALLLACDAISEAGYKPGEKIVAFLEEESGKCYHIRGESVFDHDFGMRFRLDQEKTLTDFFECLKEVQNRGYKTTLACEFEETEDTMIADIAVAGGVDQIMVGGLRGAEQTAKYNRLLKIEDILGPYAQKAIPSPS